VWPSIGRWSSVNGRIPNVKERTLAVRKPVLISWMALWSRECTSPRVMPGVPPGVVEIRLVAPR